MFSVLVVDDSSDLFARIRSYLEKSGEIRVESVHSFRQATERLKSRNYDLVFSYDQVPDVNGIEFVSEMNAPEFIRYLRSAGNSIPVIFLTRKPGDRIVLEDVSSAAEMALSPSGDLRPQLADIVTLIKQSVLRKKAERDTKLQNDQLAAILAASPLGIIQVRNRTILWVNNRIAAFLGCNEAGLTGKDFPALFPTPEEYARFCAAIQHVQDSSGFGRAECSIQKKDGTLLPCLVQAHLFDPRDVAKGGIFIVTDITEKKAMAEALRKSEAKYRDLLGNTQSIIIRMDLQGTITFINTYALAFFDYAFEDILGKNVVGTIVSPKSRSGHDLSMMADDLGFNADGYAVNVSENIRRNGDRVWIAWINKAIRDEKGHVVEVLCIGNDITDRKRDGVVRISTDTWKDVVVAETDISDSVFDAVFHICTEISIEGREGKAVGTTFLVGDMQHVLEKSRQIILNPFEGHPPESRIITNPGLKENIKALAQLDGAFVISGDGFVESVGRYITVDSSSVSLPPGMGTRHNSVAAITSVTRCVGIVVSQSGGGITVFRDGRIVKKITL
ncbi:MULTISPECIES: PAS domain S-box protein [unclassified Methanoregula]|uniref:PAS domain S-box protein n=1 Tax=unclassified Methanoregula TaxID=2649730 RepID=UPI0009CCC6FE|nr:MULTISPECIES: PAS domain S-box protein [unclassified Methanoregula]OPX65240.1 MAG: sensory histidine kinase AtoS [Methanoregula sp. PtaB.Bin085]OPY32149.1 MAG: sensory histidine kinase AtoS [Methanoregula sp. PtaU1.Bin006]